MIHRFPWWAWAAAWFAGWHLFLFSHVWADPTYLVPGPIGDNTVMLWNLAWVRYALDHGSPGFWMPKAYYPDGFLFLYGTHTWLDGVLGWLASPVFPAGQRGVILWANLVQLFASTTTGLLAMAALREWGVRRVALRLLVASALTFSAFRIFASTGHYHFFGTQWMLGALWMAARGRRLLRGGWRPAGVGWCAGAGGITGIAFLNDQTHAVFAALLVAATVGSVWFVPRRIAEAEVPQRSAGPVAIAGSLASAGAAALLVALVHIVPILIAISAGKFRYWVPLGHERIVDLTSIFLPDNRHPLFGTWLAPLREMRGWQVSEGPYIGLGGYAFLVAAFAGSLVSVRLSARRRRNPWCRVFWMTALGGGFLVLAMGEYLQVGPQRYAVLPGRLVREIPVLNNIRLMQRWIWPALLCLGTAGGLALNLWLSRGWSTRRTLLIVLISALISFEGKWTPPYPPTDITRGDYLNPPGLVDAILKHHRGGGVMMMPLEHAFSISNTLQFNANFEFNITAAYTARSPWDPTHPPWRGPNWTPDAETWLKQKRVTVVAFPVEFSDPALNLPAWMPWIDGAKAAIPELVVLDRNGREIN